MGVEWRDRWNSDAVPHAPFPPPAHPSYDLIQVVRDSLEEDSAGIGDLTSIYTIDEKTQAVGAFLIKSDGILAGLAVADEVFRQVDPTLKVDWSGKDGDRVHTGLVVGRVSGSARSLLRAERVALNFLQRMSGIASMTHKMIEEVKPYTCKVIDTRKTVPGLRLLDKWAVYIAGKHIHRVGLYDMMMVKDNHVTAAGGVTEAIRRCQAGNKAAGKIVPIEVETRTLDEVREVMRLVDEDQAQGVIRVMLDNMTKHDEAGNFDTTLLQSAVDIVGGKIETEASGNVTLQTVKSIAATGVDFISCGTLTHSVTALDISFKINLI